MCRHLGYVGPPRSLGSLMYDPPYSLERQSYAPRMSASCLLNADGFGVGWYPGDGRPPVRFRRAQPIWADVSFAEVTQVVESSCLVAAIRSATPGFPVDESCAQPFRAGTRLFSHNGRVDGFAGVEAKLRALAFDGAGDAAGDLAEVPDARAPVDSALLFALAARAWRSGAPLGDGLAEVVTRVSGLAAGRYNLLAADGAALAATAWGDTLFVRELPAAAVIASEPYDDETGWHEVPDRSLVTADPSGIAITPL
jgi:glutamine amidotransferase